MRVQTGVPGLDKIMCGGIPENNMILLTGTCGAGKTIFCSQFLASSQDPGVYVSFEEETEELRENAKTFGWDFDRMEKQNKLRVLKYDPFRIEDILEVVENNIHEIKATRCVFDSVAALGVHMRETSELRRMILEINNIMKKNRCTTIIVSEIVPGSSALSRFGVEEFVSDGIVLLDNRMINGELKRALGVLKLRGTDHSKMMHPYTINSKGISVAVRKK
ncbi:MAG TPA: ATPase domain-containing protein [archaeon]|nr:ATPase domain-containing protein [archaeon]